VAARPSTKASLQIIARKLENTKVPTNSFWSREPFFTRWTMARKISEKRSSDIAVRAMFPPKDPDCQKIRDAFRNNVSHKYSGNPPRGGTLSQPIPSPVIQSKLDRNTLGRKARSATSALAQNPFT